MNSASMNQVREPQLFAGAAAPRISRTRYRGIIFDLDGSLMDSMWIWRAIDIEFLGRHGHGLPEGFQDEIGGRSFYETAVIFKERFRLPESLEEIMAEWNRMAFEKYAHEVFLKPGADVLLQYCVDHGIRLAIATSNSRELVDQVLASNGVTDLFQAIVTGSEVTRGKPEPDVYLCAAEKIGVAPQEALAFEDIVVGIRSAKAAGMEACAVYDEASSHTEEMKRREADYWIRDFRDLAFDR